MRVERSKTVIRFSFKAEDWKGERARRFLIEFKQAVPDLIGRRYDGAGGWEVYPDYFAEFDRLREKWFTVKEQMSLFAGAA